MKFKWLVSMIVALSLCGVASASDLGNCATVVENPGTYGLSGTPGSVSVLNSMGGTNTCDYGDVLYSAFNYNALGTAAANSVTVTFSGIAGVASGLALGGTWGLSGGGFTWTYTATVDFSIAAPSTTIIAADMQESPSLTTVGMTNTITSVNGPVNVNTTPTNLSPHISEANVSSVTFNDGLSSDTGYVTGVTNDVAETVGPEPGTMLLMGGALIGLGEIVRKRRKG